MKDKYLTKEELELFLAFCKKWKIKQKDMAAICFENKSTISLAIKNCTFKRSNARLVMMTKEKKILGDLDLEL